MQKRKRRKKAPKLGIFINISVIVKLARNKKITELKIYPRYM